MYICVHKQACFDWIVCLLGSNNFVKIASSSKHSIPFTRSRVSQAMRSLHFCVCECYACACVYFSLAPSPAIFILYAHICLYMLCASVARVSFALSHMDCIKLLSVCSRDSIMFHSQPPPHTHTPSLLVLFRCVLLQFPSRARQPPSPPARLYTRSLNWAV